MKNWNFIRLFPLLFILNFSCSPILAPQLTGTGRVNVPLESMKSYPLFFKGNVYMLGGLIFGATETERGTLLELGYFPVNERGFFTQAAESAERFLALYPRERGVLDPEEYSTGTYVSIVADFTGTESGKGLVSAYPVFEIRDIHLWGDDPKKAYTPPPLDDAGRGGYDPVEPYLRN